jgi:hypothetical protein
MPLSHIMLTFLALGGIITAVVLELRKMRRESRKWDELTARHQLSGH